MGKKDVDLDIEEDFDDMDEEEEAKASKSKKAKSEKAKATGIGAAQVAEKLEANAKTFRAWLRRKVEAGEFEELASREPKSRYTWEKWSDPTLKAIMKAWKEDDHTRGGRKAKDEEESEESE